MKSLFKAAVLSLVTVSLAHGQCPGDVIPNGVVNGVDLAEILANWGPCSSCTADTNGDGQVNGVDLAGVLGGWGPCRPIINSISPREGSIDGGGAVTIMGSYLGGATQVMFGDVPAASFTQISSTRIVAIAPAGPVDAVVDVAVITSAGTGIRDNAFTFIDEVIPSWATLIEAYPDPAVVFDAELRAAIRATGYVWRVRDNATQIELVLIPPGTFNMGDSLGTGYIDEFPMHTVTITNPFYMGRYEVTQGQWVAQMGHNPSYSQAFEDSEFRPVELVSWNQVQPFLTQTSMRLPTEAEWEYAYRAGTSTAYHGFLAEPNGTNYELGLIAWVEWNCGYQPNRVGQKLGNGFGLHDMSGNVWEFTSDWYSGSYYAESPQVNPQGPPGGVWRVCRGGAWGNGYSSLCYSSRRVPINAAQPDSNGGFRVVRNP